MTKPFIDRREFLKNAGALTVSAVAASSMGASARRPEFSSRVTAVLYDERYADSRRFAERLAGRGAIAFSAGPDCVALWHGALREHLLANEGRVAGLTVHSDFVVSQHCGVELRFKPLYEGSHDARVAEALTHRIRARGASESITSVLALSDTDWAQLLADALATADLGRGKGWEASILRGSISKGHPGFLSSWLLDRTPNFTDHSASFRESLG